MLICRAREKKTGKPLTIFIDTGASHTFMNKKSAENINISKGSISNTSIATFGRKPKNKRIVLSTITLLTKHNESITMKIRIIDDMQMKFCCKQLSQLDQKCLNLNELSIPENIHEDTIHDVDILIGQDHIGDLLGKNPTIKRLPSGMITLETVFGICISGVQKTSDNCTKHIFADVNTCEAIEHLNPDLRTMWDLDQIGIADNPDKEAESEINQEVTRQFEESTQIIGNKAYVQFPFNGKENKLCDNKRLAYKRLMSQLKRLNETSKERFEEYNKIIKTQKDTGIIEEAPHVPQGPVYYIPHSCVVKDSKTTKVRIVYDASSHYKGELSLNDCIHTGPSLLPNIVELLLRTRNKPLMIISDIEKAFHQVYLQEPHRDVTRFYWVRDIHKPVTSENVVTYRFCRVPFGINASPYLLNMTIQYFLTVVNKHPWANQILRNIYVDNLILDANSADEAMEIYKTTKDIFKNMGMNLREYRSSDSTTNKQIREEDRANDIKQKVLGMSWDTDNDTYEISVKISQEDVNTKRKVWKNVAKNFDPLGIVSPLLIEAKVFKQYLCIKNYNWDQKLDEKDIQTYRRICDKIVPTTIKIPRYLKILPHGNKLIIFGDASEKGYAACAYVLSEETSQNDKTLLISKCKLYPVMSKMTIPRGELMAILATSKLALTIIKESDMNIREVSMFSDSTCALSWVIHKNVQSLDTFTRNRVREIRSNIDQIGTGIRTSLYYVPTDLNPADLGTKGVVDSLTLEASTWFTGPRFIHSTKEQWPEQSRNKWIIPVDPFVVNSVNNQEFSETDDKGILNLENQSSWLRLLNSTVRILKICKKWMNRVKLNPNSSEYLKEISSNHVINTTDHIIATKLIIADHQVKYQKDVDKITKNHVIAKDDNGIWRLMGRINNSTIEENSKNPIIIIPKDNLHVLLIKHHHHATGHGSMTMTLSSIRQQFWFPKNRQKVKNLLSKCIRCKRMTGNSYQYPHMPQLQKERVQISHPFTHTGVDYMGPLQLHIKNSEGTVETQKRWIVLFTCLTTRLIHLEIVTSLSGIHFIHALKRFSARRGNPKSIVSDNGTSFGLAAKLFHPENKDELIMMNQKLQAKGIEWKFITPLSPWKGGVYEKMIGLTKKALYKIEDNPFTDIEQFHTTIAEVEAIVNSRPLTYISSDPEAKILRPIDFISPGQQLTTQISVDRDLFNDRTYKDQTIKTAEEAVEHFKEFDIALKEVWNQWQNEYLKELQERHKNAFQPYSKSNPPQPRKGDVVIIKDQALPRHEWKLGIVEKAIIDADDKCRQCLVRTTNGKNLHRSTCHLIPTELQYVEAPKDGNKRQTRFRGTYTK